LASNRSARDAQNHERFRGVLINRGFHHLAKCLKLKHRSKAHVLFADD